MHKGMAVILAAMWIGAPALAADGGASQDKQKPRLICKPVEETGSRMGHLKMCMTAAAWKARDAEEFNHTGEEFARERVMSDPARVPSPQ